MDIKDLAQFEIKILLNVWEMYEEAKWLNKLGHHARAYALAHLALEECAKITFLSFLAQDIFMGKDITPDDIHNIFSSKLFTSHKLKLRITFLKLPGYDYQTTISQIHVLNELKNRSIYSDIFEGEIYKPSDFFGKEQASTMIQILENVLRKNLEEVGISSIKRIKRLTNEMIEQHYANTGGIFTAQREILNISNNTSYIDQLEQLIKDEELFNRTKAAFKND